MAELDLSSHEGRVRAARSGITSHVDSEKSAYGDRFVAVEVSTEVAEHQRMQTRVPTRSNPTGTVLSMGRRHDGHNRDGFGLTTIAHVDVAAMGGKVESRMTLQANGQIVLQSDMDSAYVVSAAPLVLSSSAVTNVMGAAGVVIASGAAVPLAPWAVEGEDPETPAATQGHVDDMQAQVDAWTTVNDDLTSAASDRDSLQSDMSPNQASELGPAKDAIDLAQLATDTFKGPNELGTVVEGSAGALALTGGGGVLVSTPKSAMTYAGEWLGLKGATVSVVGDAVDQVAKQTWAATSHDVARLYSAKRMDVVAKDDTLHIASRTGPAVEVQAPAIHVGTVEPESPQVATKSVSVKATDHVGLSTGSSSPDEGTAGFHVLSHDVITGSSEKSVTLDAVDKLTFEIKDAQIQVVIDKGKKITIKTPKTTLEVTESGTVVKQGAEVMKASNQTCFIGPSASSRFEASSSSVSVKGSSIKIG
ncbi:MAG: hypothetical protein H6719_19290 [Sandaracinaceae bacterium]|nr:hypothetical protein [Sandaracinaceae bacterium]